MLNKKRTFPIEYRKPNYWTEDKIDWESQGRAKCKNSNEWLTIQEGKATGRIIGGNLNTMEGIFGSNYMPDIQEGDILFIEDSLKDAAIIERSFSMLKCANVFDKIAGIILGKHELFDNLNTDRKPYEILMEVFGKKNIPILAEFDCCHTHPMFTLPIGATVELDSTNQKVTILEF